MDRKAIKEVLGFKDMGSKVVYLENSFIFGRNKTKEFFKLKEKVKSRLEGWNKHLLSKSGKASLIKSIIQDMPSYIMTICHLPLGVYEDLDALAYRLWWETKPNESSYLSLKV